MIELGRAYVFRWPGDSRKLTPGYDWQDTQPWIELTGVAIRRSGKRGEMITLRTRRNSYVVHEDDIVLSFLEPF